MNIAFFEIQPWEEKILQKFFPEASFTLQPLSSQNVANYQSISIVSCFIYSKIDRSIIEQLPNLTCIATRSTGYDHIDVAYARQKNICVSNVPEYGSHTVAEHTFALILTLTRKVYQSINQMKSLNFNHSALEGVDLHEKTIGIIGLGKIGLEVVKIAQGFGMRVLVYTRTPKPELASQYHFLECNLEELLRLSDIISLHVPYSPQTHHLINKDNILKMKPGAYLVNTARGGLIDSEAILLGLQKNILAGVGLDVLEGEKDLTEEIDILSSAFQKNQDFKTLALDHVLMNHPQVIVTPHNAFNSREALLRILDVTQSNIQNFIDHKSCNMVK